MSRIDIVEFGRQKEYRVSAISEGVVRDIMFRV